MRSVRVDFEDDEVYVTVKRPESSPSPRIVPTKQTIVTAFLLYNLLDQRGLQFAESVIETAKRYGERLGHTSVDNQPDLGTHAAPYDTLLLELFTATADDLGTASRAAEEALIDLENDGLVVDPGFTGEFMVLLGLIPMHFSVRTPKGERIYRRIRLNAPLWWMEISKGHKDGKNYTDWEFKFRGITYVRAAIRAMAQEYFQAENSARRKRGRPVLPGKSAPDLED